MTGASSPPISVLVMHDVEAEQLDGCDGDGGHVGRRAGDDVDSQLSSGICRRVRWRGDMTLQATCASVIGRSIEVWGSGSEISPPEPHLGVALWLRCLCNEPLPQRHAV